MVFYQQRKRKQWCVFYRISRCILLPDRCGVHEPLRYNFDKDKVSTYVDWISFPAGCLMLKKKRKFDVEIGNRFWGVIWLDGEL